ncbi:MULTISPECIES: thioredoxin family protein [unclassified Mycoplasma]|uniref:thioredoxin domain-containing protein n=1 Tax=unclassified Mycoplasma TaxID=2683645 RepID=UPI000FDE11F8
MPLEIINGREIQAKLTSGTTIVNFFAEWCGPCRMMAPVLEQLAEQNPQITVLKVNLDTNREVAAEMGVQSVPTTFIYHNQKLKSTQAGFMPMEVLKQQIAA